MEVLTYFRISVHPWPLYASFFELGVSVIVILCISHHCALRVGGTDNCLFGSHVFRARGTAPSEQNLKNLTQEASTVPDLDDEMPHFEL